MSRLVAWWRDPGRVEWHVALGRGWQISGHFGNCVSKKCLMRRVRLIVKAPREPPSRVYRLADTALDYLLGLVYDVELDSYEIRLGVSIGVADRYDKALTETITTRLTGKRIQKLGDSDSVGGFPELFLSMSLTYDAYDCPHSDDELCEGWWLGISAVYSLPGEFCTVEWSRYVGTVAHMIDRDAVLHAAYKALRHAYNTPTVALA
jgi:hypothetical protein